MYGLFDWLRSCAVPLNRRDWPVALGGVGAAGLHCVQWRDRRVGSRRLAKLAARIAAVDHLPSSPGRSVRSSPAPRGVPKRPKTNFGDEHRSRSEGAKFLAIGTARSGSENGARWRRDSGLDRGWRWRPRMVVSFDTHNEVSSAAVPLSGGSQGWRTGPP